MPPLDLSGPPVSFYEFWPMSLFYGPVFLYVLWLMARYRGINLPTLANPSFPGGGFYGESKSAILDLAVRSAPQWVAPFIAVDRPERPADVAGETRAALRRLADAGLCLPVVAKPDLGCRGAGVRLVRTEAELAAYLHGFPAGARLVLQRFADFEGEAGIFYVRKPGTARGRILSLTLKYFPRVAGDGRATLRELILRDPRAGKVPHLYLPRHAARLDDIVPAGEAVRLSFSGSHSKGSIFRDGTHLVSEAMQARFDAIARAIPEFYFGRFDVRFPSFEALQRGEGFVILEINGAGAEMTHVWDRRTKLLAAWRDIMRQYRLLFEIGRLNRDRGHRGQSLAAFWRQYRRENALTAAYPLTQ
ncbi:MAG: D-alanine--D-alanine ligase [Alphaproteobacteria bacterium]|nr:D-alanine--D-alanine ligase [Alphaproteobacteria bacterium]